ncbi:MAG: hypothetical protein JSS76_11000 [Bacteroidetes bacterium]|nr:hypothetical protein [Bacteroidota bacterium]
MAKHNRHISAAKQGQLARLEQSEVFDDNLLPDAAEIEKLHSIDPDILTWLKSRAEKEQDFRHKGYTDRVKLVDEHNCREHNTVRYGLTIYFVLVFMAGLASFYLLMAGKNLQGSLFGGAAAILALAVLIRKPPKDPLANNKQGQGQI